MLPTGDPTNPKPNQAPQLSRGSADRAIGSGGFPNVVLGGRTPGAASRAPRAPLPGLAGYQTYFPRLREHRISHGRRNEIRPPLFPGYCFLTVEAQWYAARWSIGVIGLIMDGVRPARVADQIIDDLRKRERSARGSAAKWRRPHAGKYARWAPQTLTGTLTGHSRGFAFSSHW